MSIQPDQIGSLFKINGKANSATIRPKMSTFQTLEFFQNKKENLEKEQLKTKKNNKAEIADCDLQISLCQDAITNPKKSKR